MKQLPLRRQIPGECGSQYPHIGARSGAETTQTAARRRSRSTRRNSVNPRAGLGKNGSPSWHNTASKEALSKGSAWPSAATAQNDGSFNR